MGTASAVGPSPGVEAASKKNCMIEQGWEIEE
jgi:hypothetical protein